MMSFLHQNSAECNKTELDIFHIAPTQTAIESCSWVQYNPIATLNENSPIEFNILGTGLEYIDLNSTQIFVRIKIVNGDNTDIDGNSHVAPVNLVLHSLFSDCSVSLNNVKVSCSNGLYGYRSYISTLLSYGSDAKKSQLTAEGYYRDVAGAFNEGNPHAANLHNTGLRQRNALITGGRTLDLIGGLHSDLFMQERFLLPDINVGIKLARQKHSYALISDDAAPDYKVNVLDCKLYVRKAKINPSAYLAHAKMLQTVTCKIPVRRTIVKAYGLPVGCRDNVNENVCSGQVPSKAFVTFVSNSNFNGQYSSSPYHFGHHNVTQLKLSVDGHSQTALKTLEMNYAAQQWIEAYISMFTGTGKYKRDESIDIDRNDYAGGYAIYGFDLSPDNCDSNSHYNLVREGSLRVDVKFSQALTVPLNVILFLEFDNLIEIDRDKNVIFDYTN